MLPAMQASPTVRTCFADDLPADHATGESYSTTFAKVVKDVQVRRQRHP